MAMFSTATVAPTAVKEAEMASITISKLASERVAPKQQLNTRFLINDYRNPVVPHVTL